MTSQLSNRSIYLAYFVWWGAWILIHCFVIHHLGWPYSVAIIDSLVSNLTLATIGIAIFNTLRFYQPRKENYTYLRISVLLMAFFSAGLTNWLIRAIIRDNEAYILKLHEAFPIRFCYNFLMVSFISLLNWVWYYFKAEEENKERANATEKMAKEAELSNIRQQLQPHFLFNSLNSISALLGSRPEEARKMIQQLSDFLRGTLRKDDSQLITLEEELGHLKLYLDIEKVRFGHRLNTEVIFDESCRSKMLPSLLLQPLVENAIKFGLYDTVGDITITIKAMCDEQQLYISISNPYDKDTARPRQGTGYGLSSVQRRLYLLYARNDLVATESGNNIFTSTVKIPQQ